MSFKKSVGWANLSINPIKGKCKGGCWYCYYSGERGMLNRFKIDPQIRLDMRAFWTLPKKPSKIFLCSTHELFGDWIPKDWRDEIFETIEACPQHTFQILTKMPENIDRPMPDNCWLGVSITGAGDQERMAYLSGIKAKTKFISWEPLLANPLPPGWRIPKCVNWVIVGRLTGHGKKHDPKIDLIADLIMKAHIKNVPIFLKNNLKEIWYGKLIQEFPLAISVVKSDRQ